MGRRYLAIPVLGGAIPFLLLAGVVAFLLLFSADRQAEAVTFKTTLSSEVSCGGLDGTEGNADDSCTPAQKHDPGVTADLKTIFAIPAASPMHSNYAKVVTFGTPVSWWVALDSDIGNGAYIGQIVARATLSLLNQSCSVPYNLTLTIPLYDCSTDITDTIAWTGDGSNLTADANANGLPDGCDKYPTHALLDPDGTGPKPPLQPRARGYGYTNAVADAPPTQINFLLFNPGELTLMPNPEGSMGDSLGYGTYVVLDNPTIGEAAPSAITEFCTPLDTTSTTLGLTAGEGKAIAKVGAQPEFSAMCTGANIGVDNDGDTVVDDGCFVVTDKCRDGIDNDGDTKTDELCDLVRQMNPTVPGIYNTGTHLADTYADSNRDYDGDGVANANDGCPCNDAGGDGAPDPDSDNDGIPDVCDPTPSGGSGAGCPGTNDDCDGDGFQNRQDNCPLHPNGGPPNPNHLDTDSDGIGDVCEGTNAPTGWNCGATSATVPDGPYTNDMTISGICIGETDTDGDGWCDSTETLLGSDPNVKAKTPEFKGIDYKVVAAQTPPGQAPQSCTNLSVYSTGAGAGTAVDDDADGSANAADSDCSTRGYDKTRSEDGCAANTCGDLMDNGAACDGTGTDGADAADPDCWTTGLTDSDVDGMSNGSDSCAGTARGVTANPGQLNTDANYGWTGDATGDACDADADNDGADNKSEWGAGTDPKSPHGASPFDLNVDQKVSILDVLLYKPKLSPNPYDYNYDMNLDGSVSILDVLLFKPVLGQTKWDKYDMGVDLAGTGVTQNPDGSYSITMIVNNTVTITATSKENNRGPDTVPAGSAAIFFKCDAESTTPPNPAHNKIECGWVPGAGTQTTRDRFNPVCREDIITPAQAYLLPSSMCMSAVMHQVTGRTSTALEPGDGFKWIAESALRFLSTVSEPKNTQVNFVRDFQLRCTQAGSYTVRIYNKTSPIFGDAIPWDNESRAVLKVTCS